MVKRSRISERVVQRQIVQLLTRLGCSVYVLGTVRRKGDYQGTMQTPGIPDLWVFLPARLGKSPLGMWIEVKAEGGKLSPAQVDFEHDCRVTRTPYLTGNLETVEHFLVERGWLSPMASPLTDRQSDSASPSQIRAATRLNSSAIQSA